jgi:hypothetical protein
MLLSDAVIWAIERVSRLSEFVSWLNIHVIVLILFFNIIRIFTALSDILFGDVVNVGLSESDRLGFQLLLGVVLRLYEC